jgi:hypothetical protein
LLCERAGAFINLCNRLKSAQSPPDARDQASTNAAAIHLFMQQKQAWLNRTRPLLLHFSSKVIERVHHVGLLLTVLGLPSDPIRCLAPDFDFPKTQENVIY